MSKKSKLSTPAWILEGYDSLEEYKRAKGIKDKKSKKGKTYKIRKCPECRSDDVGVVLSGEEGKGTGEWECRKCGWKGTGIEEDEVSEEDFIKYIDKKSTGENKK